MMKIAIIDDKINSSFLQYPERLVKIYFSKRISKNCKHSMTHATLCAKILEKSLLNQPYELYNFDVIGNGNDNIKKLKFALIMCTKMEFDIICMSIGTVCLSNSNLLSSLLKRLSKKTVLIAAISNKGYFTIPASLDYVIGVAAFNNPVFLEAEKIYKVSDNPLGIDFITGYKKTDFYDSMYCRGNSLVVPVLAAKCARIVEKTNIHNTIHIKDILKRGSDFFQVKDTDILCEKNTRYIPSIFVSTKIGIDETYLLNVLSLISKKYFWEGMIWTNRTINDLRAVTFPVRNTQKYLYSDYRILFKSESKKDNCILYVYKKNDKIIIYDTLNKLKDHTNALSVKRLAHVIARCLEKLGNIIFL